MVSLSSANTAESFSLLVMSSPKDGGDILVPLVVIGEDGAKFWVAWIVGASVVITRRIRAVEHQ